MKLTPQELANFIKRFANEKSTNQDHIAIITKLAYGASIEDLTAEDVETIKNYQ